MDVSAIALQGLNGAQARFEKAANGIAASAGAVNAPGAADAVSLSDQAVGLLSAKNDFSANLRVLHVADDMTKSTLDLLA